MTSWYIASGEWVRPECNCQIYKEANWQTHTDGKITNPYMRAGRAKQPGGDDETQTKTLTHRRAPVTSEALLKVSDICLLVLLFFFLDAQIAQWVKTGRAPWSAEAEYVHFLFPKPFLLTGRSTFFSRHPPFVVFFLSLFSLFFKNDFPTTVALPFVFNRYNSNAESLKSHKSNEGLCSIFTTQMVWMDLLPELKSSFNLIAFSLLLPPTSNMQRNQVKHVIQSLGEKLYPLSTFLAQFHATLMNFFCFLFQANAGWGVSEFIKSCRRRS